jgi:hypothetical protein
MFYFDDFQGKKVLKSTLLANCEHFFTTRDFVLAQGSCENLEKQVEQNIDSLLYQENISKNELFRCQQTHSSNIEIAQKNKLFYENTDGIILTEKNTATFLNFADCIPLIFYDEKLNIGAVIHAGWRGTAEKIQQKTVEKFKKLNSNVENLVVAIGAGIGKCCFDVNEDVFEKIFRGISKNLATQIGLFFYDKQCNKYYVDLKLVNKYLLNQVGVHKIDVSDYCTSCQNDIFFSYRKENGITARHSAFLKIKG